MNPLMTLKGVKRLINELFNDCSPNVKIEFGRMEKFLLYMRARSFIIPKRPFRKTPPTLVYGSIKSLILQGCMKNKLITQD
jgi:hypothetical protein